jgi:integrase
MQHGHVYKRHGSWHLRYRLDEIGPDGQPRRREVTKRLAAVDDNHRSKKDVEDEVQRLLAKAGRGGSAEGSLPLKDFIDRYFLPFVAARKKASTHKFYKDTLKNHITPALGGVKLRDVGTVHVQRMLDAIDLSHPSLQRIKTAASAVMSHALRLGFLTGANPVHEAKPEGRRSDFEGHAYTWADVQSMLADLEEPARTVVAVAAFTGLRESEIRGLQWVDYSGEELFVRRSVWRKAVGEVKTPESKSRVPVITPLRKLLDAHRRQNGKHEWMFAGPKGFALNLDNLTKRDIRPALGERFKGWHAFRRGLVGILFDAGVDVEVAKTILRHSDSSVTRRHYLVLKSQNEGREAMEKLEKVLTVRDKRGTGKTSKKRKSRAHPHE